MAVFPQHYTIVASQQTQLLACTSNAVACLNFIHWAGGHFCQWPSFRSSAMATWRRAPRLCLASRSSPPTLRGTGKMATSWPWQQHADTNQEATGNMKQYTLGALVTLIARQLPEDVISPLTQAAASVPCLSSSTHYTRLYQPARGSPASHNNYYQHALAPQIQPRQHVNSNQKYEKGTLVNFSTSPTWL